MDKSSLFQHISQKSSFLCVGLDTDPRKVPDCLRRASDPVLAFNKAIIDATSDLCVAYKPNLAFYESMGAKGWKTLEKTMHCIPETHFTIADAKRGDIGNTARMYARAFFEHLNFDAVTVAPYMGEDSVAPFLEFDDKWVIVLALTSNEGSKDFQMSPQEGGEPLYEKVMRKCMQWGSPEQLMFVAGATHPEKFTALRRIAPDHFFLVPGIGAQGGDLEAVVQHGRNDQLGLLINSSRGILYAGNGPDFAEKAREVALRLKQQMEGVL